MNSPSSRSQIGLILLVCTMLLGTAGCGGALSERQFAWVSGTPRLMAGQSGAVLDWRQRVAPEYDGAYVPVERAVAALDPSHDRVYIGTSGGHLYALNAGGGRLYRYDAGAGIGSELLLDRDADELFVGTENAELHVLRASTGELKWRADAGGPVREKALLHGDMVFTVSATDQVTAFARDNGEVLWTYNRAAPETFSITEHAGLTFAGGHLLTGFTDGTVVALEPEAGGVVWERDTSIDVEAPDGGRPEFVDVDTTPLVVGDTVIVASFAGGLYELELESGTVRSQNTSLKGITNVTRHGEYLVMSSAEAGIICVRLDDREEIWRHALARGAPSDITVSRGVVLVGESLGSFISLALETGTELSRLDAGTGFSARAVTAGGRGFVLSNGGSLFAFGI